MKRMILVCSVIILCLVIFCGVAISASDLGNKDETATVKEINEPSNVMITVVMPDPVPAEEPAPVIKLYPSDVQEIRDDGNWQIIKTYELNADDKPEDIPRESFERSGWNFTLTDIIRKETANAEVKEHSETVTVNTDTKELEKILSQLAPTMEHQTEDGFAGILSLDVSSIKVATAGTKTSSYTMSITREYPHLSSNDTSFVPKTVEDRGTTYTLAGVDWQAGNFVTVDYEQLPEYYTAVASYTATGYSTTVTGYTTTAVYTGTLAKLSRGKTVYTAYFLGEEIQSPLETTLPEPESTTPTQAPPKKDETNNHLWGALFIFILLLAIQTGGVYYLLQRKVNHHEKNLHSDPVAADNGNNSNSVLCNQLQL